MLLAEELFCTETEELVLIYDCSMTLQTTPVFWPVTLPDKAEKRISDLSAGSPECLTILTRCEWATIFSSWGKFYQQQNVLLESPGLIIEMLEDCGMKACIKIYKDEDYLVIFGVPEILQYFVKDSPEQVIPQQRLRIGVAGLSTDWGITTSVHILASVDVIAGAAIPDIQYLLNDEHLLILGGIKQAILIANAITVVSTLLLSDESFPVSKVVDLGLMLVSVVLPVNISDKIKEYFTVQVTTFASGVMNFRDCLT
ncbi:hypothetical protein VA7868_00474 [Vibrio aerogenes CECT 7868]|uniref:Uncharacterized protein n=2 Tax=Vibrio aerogenes TaxID=92172 RepID=A0A1M5VRS3_9VIBR|nr:hypothetical protein VA7868_00474 [Vibrio aerogenes CECT 7868]